MGATRRPLKWEHSLQALVVDTITPRNMERWLEAGGHPNDPDGVANRALHIIASSPRQKGAAIMVPRLVSASANLDALNSAWKTPLFIACEHRNVECVRALLEAGANVHITDKRDRDTPLHAAALVGSEECVKMLLPHYPSADITNKLGGSPLISACWGRHVGCMRLILDSGASMEIDGLDGRALEVACFTHHINSVQLLLHRGASTAPQENGITLLMQVCRHAEMMPPRELLSLLLALPTNDVNAVSSADSTTVLDMAVASGHTEMVRILLAAGADPDSAYAARAASAAPPLTRSPLLVACRRRNSDMVRILLEAGARTDTSDATAALDAIMNDMFNPHPAPRVFAITQQMLKAGVSTENLRVGMCRNLTCMWQQAELDLQESRTEVENLKTLTLKTQELFISIALEARRLRQQGPFGSSLEATQEIAARPEDSSTGATSPAEEDAPAQSCEPAGLSQPHANGAEKPPIGSRERKLPEAAPTMAWEAGADGIAQPGGLSSVSDSMHCEGWREAVLQEAGSRSCPRGVKKARIWVPGNAAERSADFCTRVRAQAVVCSPQDQTAAPAVQSLRCHPHAAPHVPSGVACNTPLESHNDECDSEGDEDLGDGEGTGSY